MHCSSAFLQTVHEHVYVSFSLLCFCEAVQKEGEIAEATALLQENIDGSIGMLVT